MKTILKVLYWGFMLIISFVVFWITYNAIKDGPRANLITEGIETVDETGQYEDLLYPILLGDTPITKQPVVSAQLGNNDTVLSVFETVTGYQASYTINDSSKTVYRVESTYLFVLLHPKYSRLDIGGSTKTNACSIKFFNEDGTSYPFYFTQNADINKSYYVKSPTTEKTAVLNCEHDLFYNINYGYEIVAFTIPVTTASFISEELNNKAITSFNLFDNEDNKVYASNVSFEMNYTSDFFTDFESLTADVNTINTYTNSESIAEQNLAKAAQTRYDIFLSDPDSVISNFSAKYMLTAPSSLAEATFKTALSALGRTLLFLVAAGLIFFLLFYFGVIRKFISRLIPKKEVVDKGPMPKSTSQKVDTNERVIDAEIIEETPAEAPVEEVVEEETPAEAPVEESAEEETPAEDDTIENTEVSSKE